MASLGRNTLYLLFVYIKCTIVLLRTSSSIHPKGLKKLSSEDYFFFKSWYSVIFFIIESQQQPEMALLALHSEDLKIYFNDPSGSFLQL